MKIKMMYDFTSYFRWNDSGSCLFILKKDSHLSEEKLIKLIEHLLKLESIYTFDNLLKLEF